MTEVFDAADIDSLGVAGLASVAPQEWAELRFELHPSARRLTLAWNAPQIWKAVTDGADVPEVAFSPEPLQWLLWRQDLRTYFRSLQPGEAQAFDAAREGQSFGELCALLCTEFGEAQAPATAAGFLRDWVESGLRTAVRLEPV